MNSLMYKQIKWIYNKSIETILIERGFNNYYVNEETNELYIMDDNLFNTEIYCEDLDDYFWLKGLYDLNGNYIYSYYHTGNIELFKFNKECEMVDYRTIRK